MRYNTYGYICEYMRHATEYVLSYVQLLAVQKRRHHQQQNELIQNHR